jgi:hypothetical protein
MLLLIGSCTLPRALLPTRLGGNMTSKQAIVLLSDTISSRQHAQTRISVLGAGTWAWDLPEHTDQVAAIKVLGYFLLLKLMNIL